MNHLRPRPAELAIAGLAALVLLTGTGRALATAGDGSAPKVAAESGSVPRTPPKATPTKAPTKAPPKAPTTLAGIIPVLEDYVQAERGLRFKRPVKVEILSNAAFTKALTRGEKTTEAEDAQDEKDYEASLATLLDLDLVRDRAEVEDYLDSDEPLESILGFYDPETKRLVVRGTKPTPFVQQTIVHELTHALDDQWFDLDRPELEGDAEAELAFDTLVEGSATRVDEAWYDDQPRAVRRDIDRTNEDLFGDSASGPDVLAMVTAYPYFAGPELARELLELGGQERLDDAFRAPPTTTEQVLDPDLPAAPPVATPPHPRGSTVLESDALGELGLALLLRENPLDPDAALAWTGDRYVTYALGRQTCTIVDVRTATQAAQQRVLEATSEVLDAVALGTTGVRLKGCARR